MRATCRRGVPKEGPNPCSLQFLKQEEKGCAASEGTWRGLGFTQTQPVLGKQSVVNGGNFVCNRRDRQGLTGLWEEFLFE